MRKRAIICAALALAIPTQASAESWLCIPDMATGFTFDAEAKRWRQTNFNVEGVKYLISKPEFAPYAYTVTEFGKKQSIFDPTCKNGPNEVGVMACTGLVTDFKFSEKNLRYIRTTTLGYAEPYTTGVHEEGGNTPNMEIGRCSKI